MKYRILLAPQAVHDLKHLPANERTVVTDAIEEHLRHQPTLVSRSRIKRLRGVLRPQYRLRVGDVRVFYDVAPGTVEILAIVLKSEAGRWLEKEGEHL